MGDAALREFTLWVLRGGNCHMWYSDLDGIDIQEKALSLGLIEPVEVTEPCGENCECAEWDMFPMMCHRVAPILLEEQGND